MSSAICFNSDQSKILSSGNGLTDSIHFADDKSSKSQEMKFVPQKEPAISPFPKMFSKYFLHQDCELKGQYLRKKLTQCDCHYRCINHSTVQ